MYSSLKISFLQHFHVNSPSNFLLKILRPSVWLTLITITFGILTCCHGLAQNFAGLLSLRLLLGAVEAGIFPAGNLILASWVIRLVGTQSSIGWKRIEGLKHTLQMMSPFFAFMHLHLLYSLSSLPTLDCLSIFLLDSYLKSTENPSLEFEQPFSSQLLPFQDLWGVS